MLTSESQGIQKFILDRLVQIHDETLNRDSELKELGVTSSEIFERLRAKLPTEERQLLDDYDDAKVNQMNRQDEIVFSQGLMEGMIFGYWVARVSLGVEKISV